MKEQKYCSISCFRKSQQKPPRYCLECKCELINFRHYKFCGKSCSASYNNKNKKTGTKISKFEKYIQESLLTLDEEILFNSKSAIGSELDIYFPKRKLAFEINGVFHYKPIYGEEKFQKILKMDALKQEKCRELGIKLIVVDSSKQHRYDEIGSKEFLDIIVKRIKDDSQESSVN